MSGWHTYKLELLWTSELVLDDQIPLPPIIKESVLNEFESIVQRNPQAFGEDRRGTTLYQ